MTVNNTPAESLESKGTTVSLEVLAKMTGFPLELITEEIFNGKNTKDEVSLEELRSAMLNFIDSTMLVEDLK